jgi:hypothetical protein
MVCYLGSTVMNDPDEHYIESLNLCAGISRSQVNRYGEGEETSMKDS